MKMTNYESSVFPYSLHSTVNFPARITLMSFLRVFTKTIPPKEKAFFQNDMKNVA